MSEEKRWKIDLNPYSTHTLIYGLFRRGVEKGWLKDRPYRELIYTCATRAEAHAHHEKLKDLPEYL